MSSTEDATDPNSSSAAAGKRPSSPSEEADEPKTKLERRHISTESHISIDHGVLYHTMKCGICLDVPTTPITQCKTGHLVCARCRRSNSTSCRVCQEDLTETRSFAVEALIDGLKVDCKYKLCKKPFKLTELAHHTEQCEYRSIVCMDDIGQKNCGKVRVEWQDYVEHLKQVHGGVTIKYLDGWLRLFWSRFTFGMQDRVQSLTSLELATQCITRVTFIEHEGVTFVLFARREHPNLHVWINSMSTEAEAAKFFVELYIGKDKVLPENGQGQYQVKWNISISTVHIKLEDLKYSKYCATFPIKTVLGFLTRESTQCPLNSHIQLKISRILP